MPSSQYVVDAYRIDPYTGDKTRTEILPGYVPSSISGRTFSTMGWDFGGMSFSNDSVILPKRSRFGRILSQTVYVGVSLLDGKLIFLPRLGHGGWIPIAKCDAVGEDRYAVTPIPPVLPTSSVTDVYRKLKAGQALTQVFIGSSLLANGQGSGNLEGWLKTSTRYGLNFGGSTITTENASHGSMGPRYHFGILAGRTAELNASGSVTITANTAVLLRGDHSRRSGRPNAGRYSSANQKARTGLLWLELAANGGSDYKLFQEGCLRYAANNSIPTILVTGNAMGATIDIQAAGATWTDAVELMRLANVLNIPVADTAAFMMAGMLQSADDAAGIAALYSDPGTHPSVGSAGGSWPPTSGYDGYAHAMSSVARPEVQLPSVNVIKDLYVSNPNVPLECTVFLGAALQTNAGAVVRAPPYRDVSAAPHHILRQFGETNSVQIPASGAIAFGTPFCNTVDLIFQGGDQGCTVTLAPSSATITAPAGAGITVHVEAWTLARLSNPPTITSRGFKATNGTEGTLHLCAALVFQPAHEWIPCQTYGTFSSSVAGAVESWNSNTVGDYILVEHKNCVGLYIQSYTGTATANGVLTPSYDGVAAADITLLSTGGYAGIVRGKKFSGGPGNHQFSLAVKTAASGGGTMALAVPTGVGGCFAVLSG